MSHHLALRSLVQDFNSKQSSGLQKVERLAMLTSVAIAYALPLPNNGRAGSGEAFNHSGYRQVSAFVSEVNELVYMDIDRVTELAKALYINRYETVFCPPLAIEAPSVEQICAQVFDGETEASNADSKQTLILWGNRFTDVAEQWVKEFNSGE
tara:strand:- start:24 stop:482 length:459 start_codon:yes stop_codon:yes gene_type:complete